MRNILVFVADGSFGSYSRIARQAIELRHSAQLARPFIHGRTAAIGASLPPDDAFVAAAIWGSADPLERSARDAG
jgi:hypothetical protein